MQSYFQLQKTDLSGVSRVVCIHQEVGKGDTSRESWTGCTAYLCWSRRSKCYCLPRHQKSSHSSHCFEWKETRVGSRVCHWGALQSVGSCHGPVFRKSKASLSITSSPTAPARKNGAKMFCTSCLFKPNPNPLHLKWKLSDFSLCILRGITKEDVLEWFLLFGLGKTPAWKLSLCGNLRGNLEKSNISNCPFPLNGRVGNFSTERNVSLFFFSKSTFFFKCCLVVESKLGTALQNLTFY